MATTWMIKKNHGGLVMWSKLGGDPPALVVDNAVYKQVFALNFPKMQIIWGPGDYEMVLVSDGATYRIGPITAFEIPAEEKTEATTETFSKEAMNKAKADSRRASAGRPADAGPDTSVRIIHGGEEQAEANRVLGPNGLGHGIVLEDGIPAKKQLPEPVAVGGQVLMMTEGGPRWAAAAESAEFTLLLRNIQKKILLRREDWADRLRAIPDLALKLFGEVAPPSLGNPLTGRCYVGFDAAQSSMDTTPFTLDFDLKVNVYLSVWEEFQNLESYIADKTNPDIAVKVTADEDAMNHAVLLLLNAATLALIETGWAPDADKPFLFSDPAIVAKIRQTAEFVASKDKEYGQPIRRHGLPGLHARLFDKLCRYTNLKATGGEIKFESVADSAQDLVGYSLIIAGAIQEILD